MPSKLLYNEHQLSDNSEMITIAQLLIIQGSGTFVLGKLISREFFKTFWPRIAVILIRIAIISVLN